MSMWRKIVPWIGFLALGLFLGYLWFGPKAAPKVSEVTANEEPLGRWTCSMHPQINAAEGEKCPLCAMDLVWMGATDGEATDLQFTMGEQAMALANIETMEVLPQGVEHGTLTLSGTIATNKETEAVQTTLFDGRIDALYPNAIGKRVYKGQEIGLVYSPDLYLAQDKLLTSVSYRETHQKLYQTARNTLGLWKVTDQQIDTMLKRGKPFKNFPLVADVSGTVVELYVKEGNFYKEGQPLFRTADLRSVWAVLDAYESQLPHLKQGQDITLFVKALNMAIPAKVDLVEPLLDEATRTVPVRVVLDNAQGLLKPGMFVEGSVAVSPWTDGALIVPKSAVLWTGKRSIVYKKPDAHKPVFELVTVTLGQSLDGHYQVLEGLSPGDRIVVHGAFTLDAAAQLQGKHSMMGQKDETKEASVPHQDGGDHGHHERLDPDMGMVLPHEGLLMDYMGLKNALVATDHTQARKYAGALVGKVKGLAREKNGAAPQWQAMALHLDALRAAPDMKGQRVAFKGVSTSLMALVPLMGHLQKNIYQQYCECVADGGGRWLSFEQQIRNPYFGDAMLTCGQVEKVFE